ncbi:ABC transporter permease [Caldinitratiruptor microaerophilus]|uniref:Autoinducer 2 import system permease protein LsrD n=1 Tax=Caldinitratiruptor microaerophilus TaxID=671077 RepID=A0AA35CJH6_9FIRM|nr:ABC transporter permease [Caldinitratiruptor microaerophilus]BDG60420.1 ribose import permease protein RbsC [Caldinitratiruptor microaerophilus]
MKLTARMAMADPAESGTPQQRRPGGGAAPQAAPARRRPWPRETFLAILLVAAGAGMSVLSPHFLTAANLMNVLRYLVETGIIALPMTLIIITGGIDLSVGSILGLSGLVMGILWRAGVDIWVAALLALVAGAAAGLLNALFITRLGIPPLVVTVATMTGYRGLALALSQARPVSGFPRPFLEIGQGYVGPVPVQVLVLLVLAVVFHVLLTRTVFGRRVFALGLNETAARYSGIQVARVKVWIYTLSGLLSALAALILVARTATARADAGTGLELDVVTAVVLGGTKITGGEGSIAGTVLGLLLIGIISNGLDLAGIPSVWRTVALGAALILAILINQTVWRNR